MGAKVAKDKKVVIGVITLSVLAVIRLYIGNILLNEGYVSKWVFMLTYQIAVFLYTTISYPTVKITKEVILPNIPFVGLLIFADALNLVMLQKGVHMSSDYALLSIAMITLLECRGRLEQRQWAGLGLLAVGWVVTLGIV